MPSEPRWITADETIEFNRLAVQSTGEPFHVREPGLLESALARPVNRWHHGEHDRAILAAHMLLGLAHNHPFAQGNKRTALLVADAFLAVNGYRLEHPDEGLTDLILDELNREITEAEFVARFAAAIVTPRPKRERSVYRSATTGRYTRMK